MIISAGQVAPSEKLYKVVEPHGHDTLRLGDVVCMVITPRMTENYLFRFSDLTLHNLEDDCDQYVHLEEMVGSDYSRVGPKWLQRILEK